MADVLEAIGRTPMVELRRVTPLGSARVFVKVEGHNPTGSMKDRMARSVVAGALRSGDLSADGTLVEYTGGSTGTSLAFVCAAYGVRAVMVTSDAFSREKRDHMRALGAEVIEIRSHEGRITQDLIEAMIARATELCGQPGFLLADQFNNPDASAGYRTLGEEILDATDGRIDAFVQSVGTAQCLIGVGDTLRSTGCDVRLVAVEPSESAVLSGGASGGHGIEGIGPGFVPPRWSSRVADEVVSVSTSEAMAMSRRLACEEALFAGTSSGANVVAALEVAKRIGPEGRVVTLLCDSGLKYLSTGLYGS
jgi:cysteine synthase A